MQTSVKENLGERFHKSCANLVCKMLEVSMLQSLELINSVETPSFSTESVEKIATERQIIFSTFTISGNRSDPEGQPIRCGKHLTTWCRSFRDSTK